MTYTAREEQPVSRHAHGGAASKAAAHESAEEVGSSVPRARAHPTSLSPQAILHLQRVAGNKAVADVVQRMCGTDDSKITVEASAMKHKVALGGAAAKLLTADEVKRQFHVSMKYGQKELGPDDRDPTSMKFQGKTNKLVYKPTADGAIKIYHFHAYSYEGDNS